MQITPTAVIFSYSNGARRYYPASDKLTEMNSVLHIIMVLLHWGTLPVSITNTDIVGEEHYFLDGVGLAENFFNETWRFGTAPEGIFYEAEPERLDLCFICFRLVIILLS